ncbi:ASCH domain-containing protein [Archaeoglobus sp.]
MRGLIIKQPFASMIVRGEKKWEIRRTRTNVRGEVVILSQGYALGKARLTDVLGPFTVEELLKFRDYHKVDEDFLRSYSGGKKLYAWVFDEPEEFEKKVKVNIPRGAQVWVKDVKSD